jgi:hypothetical protein
MTPSGTLSAAVKGPEIEKIQADEKARQRRLRHEGREALSLVKRTRSFFSRHATRDGWISSRDDKSQR